MPFSLRRKCGRSSISHHVPFVYIVALALLTRFWLNCRYPRRRNRLILVLSPINNSCTRIFAQTMKGDTKHIHSTSFPLTGPLYGYNLSVHRLKWWFCTDLQYSSVVTASFRCSKANQPLFYSCSLRWDDLYSTARSQPCSNDI